MNDHRNRPGGSAGKTPYDKSEDATSEISKRLRALYDSVQAEPIPDRFLDLLEKLDEVDAPPNAGGRRK